MPWLGGVTRFRSPWRGYGPFARKTPFGLNRRPTPSLLLDFAGTRAVDSRITYSGGANATVIGPTGLVQWSAHNLLTHSIGFGSWLSTAAGTLTAGQTDPLAGTTATLFAGAGKNIYLPVTGIVAGQTVTFSVWLKAPTSSGTVTLLNANGGTTAATSVTTDWQRLTLSFPTVGVNDGPGIALSGTLASVLIWGAQLNYGASATTYVATTTAAAWSPRIDYDPTTLACRGLLIEEARTNLVGQPCDLTAAGWVASNITPLADQIGPDGAANSASSITATADAGTILFAITSASAARATSAYVKRITGVGAVEMTQDGGSTWAAVTVTSAWTRVSIASATVTNPSVGFRLATNTDAIAVYGVQCETGAFPTSVIPSPAALARTADVATMAVSPWYRADAGTFVVDFEWVGLKSTGGQRIIAVDDGSLSNYVGMLAGSPNTLSNLVVVATVSEGNSTTPLTTYAGGTAYRVAFAAAANSAATAVNGSVGLTDATLSMPAGIATLRLAASSAGASANIRFRRVAYYPARLSSAQLAALTK